MAGTSRQARGSSGDAPPQNAPTGTPPYNGPSDHSFTLQAIMEMQKSIGSLQSSVNNLASSVESQKSSIDDLKKKTSHAEKVMYAAGVILLCAIAGGGWLLNSAKDFAMTYYKANVEAQLKSQTAATVIPPPNIPQKQR